MSEGRTCPQCGAQLPADAADTPCSACLMQIGLESWENQNSIEATIDGSDSPAAGPGFVPPKPQELADRFPQYEILDLLGHGGMGAVYKARQKSLDRMVALKIIKPGAANDLGFAERFEREAKALARLNHPNIVSVYDLGESDGLYFFAMEYIDGTNLRRLIEAKELPPERAVEIIPQICEALQFAHDGGIVHRDIKPENILVDARGRVKIADFGLAKLLADGGTDYTLTGTNQVMGTPRYMAPEQMEGARAVDHRADIYSLGVVFYEMLTGELPLGRFDPPSRKATIDAHWDEVVLRTLEKEPGKRFQTAGDVKSEVERISDLDRPPVRMAAAIPADVVAASPVQGSDEGTTPHYGEMMLGGVMGLVALLLVMMSIAEGGAPFIWIAIGIGLGGGGCLSDAFQEKKRLPAGTAPNVGMLLQGAIMCLIGFGLMMYCFAESGFSIGNPFIWVGMGLAIGGGGVFCGAWKSKQHQTATDPLGVPPAKPIGEKSLPEDPPQVTANLVIAWFTCAVAYGAISSLTPHAATPLLSWALWCVWAIITPTMMCGVVVWVGQRRRGLRYPIHAGEWLWNIASLATLAFLVLQTPVFVTRVLELNGVIQTSQVSATVNFSILIITGVLHLILGIVAACFIREGRWRLYVLAFVLGMIARVAAHGFLIASLWSGAFPFGMVSSAAMAFSVLPIVPLVVAALADLVENKQLPWSHWVGVAHQACFHLTLAVNVVAHLLSVVKPLGG